MDMKLKTLIHACKQTGNYKKLAVVGFILVSNTIDEIALKLGTRPRNKEKKETLLKYMNVVNEIFENNLQVQIFQDEVVETVKEVELLFHSKRGDLPFDYVRKIIDAYYELRKVKVPNVYKNLTGEGYFDDSNLHLFSTGLRSRKESSSKFKPILLQKIGEQERMLQKKLNHQLDQGDLERVILLKKMKEGIDNERGLTMQGTLKDSLNYQQNPSAIIKFMFIGVALLSLFLSVIVIAEIFMFPLTLPPLSNLLLLFLGVVAVTILLYKNVFRER